MVVGSPLLVVDKRPLVSGDKRPLVVVDKHPLVAVDRRPLVGTVLQGAGLLDMEGEVLFLCGATKQKYQLIIPQRHKHYFSIIGQMSMSQGSNKTIFQYQYRGQTFHAFKSCRVVIKLIFKNKFYAIPKFAVL